MFAMKVDTVQKKRAGIGKKLGNKRSTCYLSQKFIEWVNGGDLCGIQKKMDQLSILGENELVKSTWSSKKRNFLLKKIKECDGENDAISRLSSRSD